MKQKKKWLGFMLAAGMAAALSACSSAETEETTAAGTGAQTEAQQEEPAAEEDPVAGKKLSRIECVEDVVITRKALLSSGEEQKAGFRSSEELLDAASYIISSCPHILLKGLMTVGPLGFDEERNREAFTYAKGVFDKLKALSPAIDTLSMGMSADWKTAVGCGSTEVRIGTAIFGARV